MMRRNKELLVRSRNRAFVLKDPTLAMHRSGPQAFRNNRRAGMFGTLRSRQPLVGDKYAKIPQQHAFPLLNHANFGHDNHVAQTDSLMLTSYMPKRAKGSTPWWRGADTYSVKYCEQGRFEYQRYQMIGRMPSATHRAFRKYFSNIASAGKPHNPVKQAALHWLLRMIVDNYTPQHDHYFAAIKVLAHHQLYDTAHDVWRVMERQRTIPDDKLIVAYLDLCTAAQQPEWAVECWNNYCGEKRFLQEGEIDPKPVSRVPFSLTREETLYLPKWKKHFENDPNMDVTDRNRFNTTREIYLHMALSMLASGKAELFQQFFGKLTTELMSTPTPVPEPPSKNLPFHLLPTESGSNIVQGSKRLHNLVQEESYVELQPFVQTRYAWRKATGPIDVQVRTITPKCMSNAQFLLYAAAQVLNVARESGNVSLPGSSTSAVLDYVTAQVNGSVSAEVFANLDVSEYCVAVMAYQLEQSPAESTASYGALVRKVMKDIVQRKGGAAAEQPSAAMFLQVLKGYRKDAERVGAAEEASSGRQHSSADGSSLPTKDDLMKEVAAVLTEMNTPSLVWTLSMHDAVLGILVELKTMRANEYFVKNVLRQFAWTSWQAMLLYTEYSNHADVDLWAELTKRMLVWCSRYEVPVSEELRQFIEKDYDTIKVHARSMKDLAVYHYKDIEEQDHRKNPVNELPNPWIDQVSHALPFPDRDTGYPNEYGEVGQWRMPELNPGHTEVKGPSMYAPPMEGEEQRKYHAQWRDQKAPMGNPALPDPWNRKYKEYARGNHPSYDMVYAGPFPEIWPSRVNFRRKTRWDFKNIEAQSKVKINGPY